MSRATGCLMDADCRQEYASAQSPRMGNEPGPGAFTRIINLWHERSRQRRELRELAGAPDLLKDVGLSNYDVLQEAGKPFWRE